MRHRQECPGSVKAPNALLKGSPYFGEEHEVVRDDTQDEFAPLRRVPTRGERGAEAAFVLAEAALDSLDANDKSG